MKRCARCKKDLPLDDFRVVERKDKLPSPHSYCRPCERDYSSEYQRTHRAERRAYKRAYMKDVMASPGTAQAHREYQRGKQQEWRERPGNMERERERTRRHRARVAADPEKRAQRAEQERMGYRLRQEQRGREVTIARQPKRQARDQHKVVPAAPLRSFLKLYMAEGQITAKDLAKRAEMDDSGVSQILSGKKEGVYLDTADALLVPLGFTYRAVYPDVD